MKCKAYFIGVECCVAAPEGNSTGVLSVFPSVGGGEKKITQSETMSNSLQKLPVKNPNGSIDLIEIDSIFYLEAKEGDTSIRTKRKKPYRSVQRLHELAKKLPKPQFAQCHREYIVNLNRVRSITPRKTQDHDLRPDPQIKDSPGDKNIS
jgi:hypothetical protein